jgi:hypothetical protein
MIWVTFNRDSGGDVSVQAFKVKQDAIDELWRLGREYCSDNEIDIDGDDVHADDQRFYIPDTCEIDVQWTYLQRSDI